MNTAQVVCLDNGHVSAEIALKGAEVMSLRHMGREFIWHGDPAWWSYRAPLLFPIIGRLQTGQIMEDGVILQLSPHGFARELPFEVMHLSRDSLELRLTHSPETLKNYPFAFELYVRFNLVGRGLHQVVTVINRGLKPMPASFGFHPGFRWPIRQKDRSAHQIRFTDTESYCVSRIDGEGRLIGAAKTLQMHDKQLALEDDLFADGALVFNPVASSGLSYWDKDGPLLTLQWFGCVQLGLWTIPGAPFICFEPWFGHPSPLSFLGTLTEKPGGFTIEPGESREFGLSIVV